MAGRTRWSALRRAIDEDPERSARRDAIKQAYDTILALSDLWNSMGVGQQALGDRLSGAAVRILDGEGDPPT
jgi:hypothetical protein